MDKSKGTKAMVLTNVDLEKIGEKFQYLVEESWGKIEEGYDALLTKVEKIILEFNLLAQTNKQPTPLSEEH